MRFDAVGAGAIFKRREHLLQSRVIPVRLFKVNNAALIFKEIDATFYYAYRFKLYLNSNDYPHLIVSIL